MFLAVALRLLFFFTFTTSISFIFLYGSVECTETINLTKNGFFKGAVKITQFYHYHHNADADCFLYVEDGDSVRMVVMADDEDKKNFVEALNKFPHNHIHELLSEDLEAKKTMASFKVANDKRPHPADAGTSNTLPESKGTYCQIHYIGSGFPRRIHKCPPDLPLCPKGKRFFALVKNIKYPAADSEYRIAFFQDIPLNKAEARLAPGEVEKWQLCKESADTVQTVNFCDAREGELGGSVKKAGSGCWNFGNPFNRI